MTWKKLSFLLLLLPVLSFTACKSQQKNKAKAHNSKTALDWDGIYKGVLPCADCEGIQTTLQINQNLTYKLTTRYLGKNDLPKQTEGTFFWNKSGNTIVLSGEKNSPNQYFVGENKLTQLDLNGKKITGALAENYVLIKGDYAILEKYWKLVELNGKPVTVDSTFNKEPHLIFKEKDQLLIGSLGCNNIKAQYQLLGLNKISIKVGGTTKMLCAQMELENRFLNALQTADNFTVLEEDLTLNKGKMAPLAKFKAVYMR